MFSGAVAGLGGLGNPLMGAADDMEWNPAGLAAAAYKFQFLVTPASGRLKVDDWPVETVYRLLQGGVDEDEYEDLIAAIRDGALNGTLDVSGGAHLSINSNGMSASVRGHIAANVTRDAMRLLLLGGEPGETYQLSGTSAEAIVLGDFRFASVYSDPRLASLLRIHGFHIGGTLRYLLGLEYGKATADGFVQAVAGPGGSYEAVGSGTLSTYTSHSGGGIATDLGVVLQLTPTVAVDVSVVDLGRIWWWNGEETLFEFQVDPLTGAGEFVNVGSQASNMRPTWILPTMLRGGLSVKAGDKMLWTLAYGHRLYGEQQGQGEWALASQINLFPALPLRLGAKYAPANKEFTYSLGVGVHLGPLTLDIGTRNLPGLLHRTGDASLSISTGLRF